MMVCAKLLLRWAGPAVVIPTVSLLLLSPVRSHEDAPTQTTAQASKGQPTVPGSQGRPQPQGPTGPINTQSSGGAPAESPQGETPPGMQSAPEGSSKTTKEPSK
jgi:hypothetical protein